MKIISAEELASFKPAYLFKLLPGFHYALMGEFEHRGRKFDVLLSVPAVELMGTTPAYAFVVQFVEPSPEPREVWALCPWLSDRLLLELRKLPEPQRAAAQLVELLCEQLIQAQVRGQALVAPAPLPEARQEVPGPNQPGS